MANSKSIDASSGIQERVPESEGQESGPNAEEWRNQYLRLAADLDNERKRLAQNYALRSHESQARLIRDLIPLVDNLQRALDSASPQEARTGLYSGIQIALREFLNVLKKHGVEPIDALGEPFDPTVHEAIGSTAHPTMPSGIIVHVEQTGYTFNDRLLRPARVVVAT